MYIWLSTVINAKECTTLNVRSSSFLKNCLKNLGACRKWQTFWGKIHSNELDERILRAVLRHATRVGTWFTRKGCFRDEVEWTNIFGLTRKRKIFISLLCRKKICWLHPWSFPFRFCHLKIHFVIINQDELLESSWPLRQRVFDARFSWTKLVSQSGFDSGLIRSRWC